MYEEAQEISVNYGLTEENKFFGLEEKSTISCVTTQSHPNLWSLHVYMYMYMYMFVYKCRQLYLITSTCGPRPAPSGGWAQLNHVRSQRTTCTCNFVDDHHSRET